MDKEPENRQNLTFKIGSNLNKKTLKAMRDARTGKTKKAKNFGDLCKQLGI